MIEFRSDLRVEYIDHMGDDKRIAQAARVSTGTDDSDRHHEGLVKRLWADQHTSTFEHNTLTVRVEVPIFVAREWMRHRTQCIAGDTMITFSSGNRQGKAGSIGTTRKSIAEHWEHWNLGVLDSLGRRRVLPSVKSAKVVSMNEATGDREYSRVLDVIQSGVKPVFRMTTARGKSVKATKDHKFLTATGWRVLGDIRVGDELMTQHLGYLDRQEDRTVPWSLRQAINTWTMSVSGEIYERDGGTCCQCGAGVALADAHCDHIVPVVRNLEVALLKSNLQTLCRQCERSKTRAEQSLADRTARKTLHFSPDPVVSIEAEGEEMTYDLVLDDPHHNFLGNGIVTHNSFNEISGRYTEMRPVFYVPGGWRPLVQVGKAMDYRREEGDMKQRARAANAHRTVAEGAWGEYQSMLKYGIAREVARNVLPVSLFTEFYTTANLRNWLHFLALRTDETALWEIREAAYQVEAIIAEHWPVAYRSFTESPR